ncbi:hypothetical protein Tco_1476366 [Tanacetum coccineum]
MRDGRGLAQKLVNVEVSYDLRGDCRNCVPRSLPWRESLGLRVVDSHTGNHPEDDFTPLETILRPYSMTPDALHVDGREGKVIITIFLIMSAKDSIATQTCELSKEEFNEFLTLYPILSEYRVILLKSNQTIFDAPPGFIYLGCAKLTTFVVMYKAYGFEPSVDIFLRFFNLCQADSIIPAKYSQLLSKQNKLDSKSFKDKLPPNIEENPMFQRLGRYPTSVRVFPDPILFLAGLKSSWEHGQQHPAILVYGKEMAFRNFIYTEDDEDLLFFPKEPSLGLGTGSPSVLVNTEPLKADKELVIQPAEVMADSRKNPKPELIVVHPGSVAARIKDRKCKTRGGSSRPLIKRKLAPGRATRAKNSSKEDVPFLTVSNDDEGLLDVLELKDATACHIKISAITPLAWKNHLDNNIDLELLDLHDYWD